MSKELRQYRHSPMGYGHGVCLVEILTRITGKIAIINQITYYNEDFSEDELKNNRANPLKTKMLSSQGEFSDWLSVDAGNAVYNIISSLCSITNKTNAALLSDHNSGQIRNA